MGNTINTTPVTLTGEEYREMEEDIEVELYRERVAEGRRQLDMVYESESYQEIQQPISSNDNEDPYRNLFERFMTIIVQPTEGECCVCLEATKDTTTCHHYLCRKCAININPHEILEYNDDGIVNDLEYKRCPLRRKNLIWDLYLDEIPKEHLNINNYNRQGNYFIEEHFIPSQNTSYIIQEGIDKRIHRENYRRVTIEIQSKVKEIDPSTELDLFYDLLDEIHENVLHNNTMIYHKKIEKKVKIYN